MPAKKKPSPPPPAVSAPAGSPPQDSAPDPAAFIAEYLEIQEELSATGRARFKAKLPADLRPAERIKRAVEYERELKALLDAHLERADVYLLIVVRNHFQMEARKPGREDFEKYHEQLAAYCAKRREDDHHRVEEDHNAYWSSPERDTEFATFRIALQAEYGPLPQGPYLLEPVMRWILNAPKSPPWPVLEAAFLDFLTIRAAQRHLEDAAELGGREALAELLQKYETALEDAAISPEDRRVFLAKASVFNQRLAELDALLLFVNGFKPGTAAAPGISEKAHAGYLEHWKGKPVVGLQGPSRALGLATVQDFRSFWQQHRPEYVKGLDTTKKPGGKERARQRAEERWVNFTKAFKQQAGETITLEVINTYTKQTGVDKNKGQHFLGTLLKAAKGNGESYQDMEETLKSGKRREAILLPQPAIEKCFEILFGKKKIPKKKIS